MEGAQSFCSLFRILTLTDWVSIFVKITIICKNFKSNLRWRDRSGVALMGPREGNMSHWPGKSFEKCDYHFPLIRFDFERDPDWFIPKLYLATCSHDIARPEQMHI